MKVDLGRLLGNKGPDYHGAQKVRSFHWFMPVEDESPKEFPHQDRRIGLEDMTMVKVAMVSEAHFLGRLGEESYFHPSGVIVEFGKDKYLTNSAAEEERQPLMVGAHLRKDTYKLSFYSTSSEAIRELATKCCLACVGLEE